MKQKHNKKNLRYKLKGVLWGEVSSSKWKLRKSLNKWFNDTAKKNMEKQEQVKSKPNQWEEKKTQLEST